MAKSVFISSTSQDLQDYREAVNRAIRRLRMLPIDMVDFGSQPGGAVKVSVDEVRRADYFVGVIAHRYGYVPEGADKSVTEQEYDDAVRLRKPRLMYMIDPAYAWDEDKVESDPEAQARLAAFKAKIEKSDVRSLFTTPGDLAAQVTSDLAKLDDRQRQRDFLVRMMVGVTALLAVIALGLLLAPDVRTSLLDAFGLVPPTATPVPLPAADFNVVVAGFAEQQPDGSIVTSQTADDVSDLVYASLDQLPIIDNLRGWRDDGVWHIANADETMRSAQAAQLASAFNADIVVYGIVQSGDIYDVFTPELYVSAPFAAFSPDIAGVNRLADVEILRGMDAQPEAFPAEITTIRALLSGLALYFTGRFDDARDVFSSAAEQAEDPYVLYLYAGNAAARATDFEAALDFFGSALDAHPGAGRGLIGRGSALYGLASQAAQSSRIIYDASLTLDEDTSCESAISDVPQLLALQALTCYDAAAASTEAPATADLDMKVPFGKAQVYLFLSLVGGDHWDDALEPLTTVIDLYEASEAGKQARTRQLAAHARAWSGLRLISIDAGNPDSLRTAAEDYAQAIALLENDVNRQYNRTWIDLYGQQLEAINARLSTPAVDTTPGG
ncbi:MAG: DUF4062 domain-containing protein [Anaerolineae bacterium]|nr:DUF4062 domain-containing protein [Anaerolineae bacterium]